MHTAGKSLETILKRLVSRQMRAEVRVIRPTSLHPHLALLHWERRRIVRPIGYVSRSENHLDDIYTNATLDH